VRVALSLQDHVADRNAAHGRASRDVIHQEFELIVTALCLNGSGCMARSTRGGRARSVLVFRPTAIIAPEVRGRDTAQIGHRRVALSPALAAKAIRPQPSPHSITSSARAISEGGTVRPSSFAALRLMTRLSLDACSTGRSLGLAPRSILST